MNRIVIIYEDCNNKHPVRRHLSSNYLIQEITAQAEGMTQQVYTGRHST
jgi:hypothetical protein